METKHTPGPWVALPIDSVEWVDIVTKEDGIYSLPFVSCRFFNQEANARLISAAPKLLEALTDLAEHCRRLRDPALEVRAAFAAISQATQP